MLGISDDYATSFIDAPTHEEFKKAWQQIRNGVSFYAIQRSEQNSWPKRSLTLAIATTTFTTGWQKTKGSSKISKHKFQGLNKTIM